MSSLPPWTHTVERKRRNAFQGGISPQVEHKRAMLIAG